MGYADQRHAYYASISYVDEHVDTSWRRLHRALTKNRIQTYYSTPIMGKHTAAAAPRREPLLTYCRWCWYSDIIWASTASGKRRAALIWSSVCHS